MPPESPADAPYAERDAANARAVAAWRLRWGHRALWSLPLNAGLILVAAVLLLRGEAEDPRANYVKSLAALLALAPPPVKKEENAFEDYKLAQLAYVGFTGASDDNPFWKTNDDSKYFDDAATLALWSANATAIGHLQAGAQKERCDWGIDYSVIPWACPSLLTWREHANLLALDARCRARKGDHQGAAKSLVAIHQLARHLDGPPAHLISAMVALAMDAIACEALEAVLVWDTPSKADDLSAYRKAFARPEDPYRRYARSFETEKTSTLCLMDGITSGELARGTAGLLKAPGVFSLLTYGSDRKCYEAVSNAEIEALRNGKQPEDARTLIDRFQTGPAPLTNLCIPSLSRSLLAEIEIYEHGLLVDTALVLLQFRTKYGRDPATLAELVPEFLPAIPIGPVNNEPLRLRYEIAGCRETGRWFLEPYLDGKPTVRIYTVGPNGRDDGGLYDGSSNYDRMYKGKDDTIVILPALPTSNAKEQK